MCWRGAGALRKSIWTIIYSFKRIDGLHFPIRGGSQDADLTAYYGKSFIITGDKMEEQGMDMKGFWKTYDIWVSLDK